MNKYSGFTLVEVMVSIAIFAMIAVISYQGLDVATRSKEVSESKIEDLARLDRMWLLVETDLRNALKYNKVGSISGEQVPAMIIETGQPYWLTFLRAGLANPLGFNRTEVIRVGYRLEEETLWRDSWVDPATPDIDYAKQQKILENVEQIIVRAGKKGSFKSVLSGPWVESWPAFGNAEELPQVIEIAMTIKGRGEIVRLFAMTDGT